MDKNSDTDLQLLALRHSVEERGLCRHLTPEPGGARQVDAPEHHAV